MLFTAKNLPATQVAERIPGAIWY